jgi:phosphatidylserine decarboxylase
MRSVRIDPAGVPFIGVAIALAIVTGTLISWWIGVPLAALALVFLFFFRDPHREPVAGDDLVLSPADGRVLYAGAGEPAVAPPGAWQQISIFLSPMDVHVNRIPVSGRVTEVTYRPGRFLPAYHGQAASANERCEIRIDHHGQPIVARQVVGVLARRVVCRVQPGAEVRAGDRYGVMKFGSRMDIFLPVDAELRVKPDDVVRAAETVIAVLH